MGETGCDKTALIIKLNQIWNNGEIKIEIININPGITNEKLYELMEKIDIKARWKKMKNYGYFLIIWIHVYLPHF